DGEPLGAVDVALLPVLCDRVDRPDPAIGGGGSAGLPRPGFRRQEGTLMNPTIAALMFPGMFLLIFLGVPVSLSLIVPALAAGWFAFGDQVFNQLYGGLYSAATNYILSAIPMFVLMGAILERSGIAARLFRTMQLWLGRLPGGL